MWGYFKVNNWAEEDTGNKPIRTWASQQFHHSVPVYRMKASIIVIPIELKKAIAEKHKSGVAVKSWAVSNKPTQPGLFHYIKATLFWK